MRDLRERFAPLMAEALSCAASPEWLARPLSEANDHLVELAERERAAPALFNDQDSPVQRHELELARFAVMAWVDEQMLTSPRPDAPSWAAMSLQFRYFSTAEAGRQFYQELEKILDDMGVQRKVRSKDKKKWNENEEKSRLDLNASPDPERVDWHIMDLAERLYVAAAQKRDDSGALSIFALCLLYGFKGVLYGDPTSLARIRKACRTLIDDAPPLEMAPQRSRSADWIIFAERAIYVLVPILLCAIFALYCGSVLANAPFASGF